MHKGRNFRYLHQSFKFGLNSIIFYGVLCKSDQFALLALAVEMFDMVNYDFFEL